MGLRNIVEQAELVISGSRYVFFGRRGLVQAEQHVGLAGSQPHFSHEHIFQFGGVSVLHGRQRLACAAGRHGRQRDAPFSFGIGFCFQCSVSKSDGYFPVGGGRAGNGNVFPVGKYHMGTENPVEPGGVRPRCVKGDGGSQDA